MDLNMHEVNSDISREILLELDTEGIILDISSNCYYISGYHKNELVGTNIYRYIMDGTLELDIKETKYHELVIKSKAGEEQIFDAVVTPIKDSHDKEYKSIRISLIDISKYKCMEEREKKYSMILENSKDIIYLYEIYPEKKFTYLNQAVETVLGEIRMKNYEDPVNLFDRIHPEDKWIQMKKLNGTLDYTKPTQLRIKNNKGEYVWCEDYNTPFYNNKGKLIAISGFCRNIQDRKEIEEKLQEISFYDCLTGLYSRTFYQQQRKRLNELENSSFAIIVCDLDNLKDINDKNGHTVGDKILIQFAKILKGVFGQDAIISRIGGDEYVVLLKKISMDFVKTKYYELIMSLDFHNKHNDDLSIMVSIGWSYSSTSIGVFDKFFQLADSRMYENKLSKR